MSEEEKLEFIGNVKYFWNEKGDLDRLSGFTIEKLEEADPVVASAYKQYLLAEQTLNRLLSWQL